MVISPEVKRIILGLMQDFRKESMLINENACKNKLKIALALILETVKFLRTS